MSIKTKVLGIISFLGIQSTSAVAAIDDYTTTPQVMSLAYNFIGQIFASLGVHAPTLVYVLAFAFTMFILLAILGILVRFMGALAPSVISPGIKTIKTKKKK